MEVTTAWNADEAKQLSAGLRSDAERFPRSSLRGRYLAIAAQLDAAHRELEEQERDDANILAGTKRLIAERNEQRLRIAGLLERICELEEERDSARREVAALSAEPRDFAAAVASAVEPLVRALYLYPNYRVDSRGPRGCIWDALTAVAPDVAAESSRAMPPWSTTDDGASGEPRTGRDPGGSSMTARLHPDDVEAIAAAVARLLNSGQVFQAGIAAPGQGDQCSDEQKHMDHTNTATGGEFTSSSDPERIGRQHMKSLIRGQTPRSATTRRPTKRRASP